MFVPIILLRPKECSPLGHALDYEQNYYFWPKIKNKNHPYNWLIAYAKSLNPATNPSLLSSPSSLPNIALKASPPSLKRFLNTACTCISDPAFLVFRKLSHGSKFPLPQIFGNYNLQNFECQPRCKKLWTLVLIADPWLFLVFQRRQTIALFHVTIPDSLLLSEKVLSTLPPSDLTLLLLPRTLFSTALCMILIGIPTKSKSSFKDFVKNLRSVSGSCVFPLTKATNVGGRALTWVKYLILDNGFLFFQECLLKTWPNRQHERERERACWRDGKEALQPN